MRHDDRVKRNIVVVAVGTTLLVAGVVLGGLWAFRAGPAVEYPADPADQPPVAVAFDASTLTVPGCPTEQPDEAPAAPGRASDDKLVEWAAVRLVRCTYMLYRTTYELQRIDVVDDLPAVTDAVRVLRRMLTTAQYDAYFGPSDDSIRNAAAFPTYRYLFQFPDGHVTEVDYRDGYHRDGILRHRWSVRGTSVAPLATGGSRSCELRQPPACQITGTVATLAD
jgi:hypothetical protein